MVNIILTGENVKLVPFKSPKDKEYLFTLMRQYKFEKGILNDHERAVKNGVFFWLVYSSDGILGGVIYLCYHPGADRWSLDGYRDDKLARSLKKQKAWSYEAGELVCKYFFSFLSNLVRYFFPLFVTPSISFHK